MLKTPSFLFLRFPRFFHHYPLQIEGMISNRKPFLFPIELLHLSLDISFDSFSFDSFVIMAKNNVCSNDTTVDDFVGSLWLTTSNNIVASIKGFTKP